MWLSSRRVTIGVVCVLTTPTFSRGVHYGEFQFSFFMLGFEAQYTIVRLLISLLIVCIYLVE